MIEQESDRLVMWSKRGTYSVRSHGGSSVSDVAAALERARGPRPFDLFGVCFACGENRLHHLGTRRAEEIERSCRACGHVWIEQL